MINCFTLNFPKTYLNFLSCPRFRADLKDIIWDLNLPTDTSPEEVRDRLVVEAERMSHAQEVTWTKRKCAVMLFLNRMNSHLKITKTQPKIVLTTCSVLHFMFNKN